MLPLFERRASLLGSWSSVVAFHLFSFFWLFGFFLLFVGFFVFSEGLPVLWENFPFFAFSFKFPLSKREVLLGFVLFLDFFFVPFFVLGFGGDFFFSFFFFGEVVV